LLGVNTITVLRALRLLRNEGLLEFQRGRGISSQTIDKRAFDHAGGLVFFALAPSVTAPLDVTVIYLYGCTNE
jgi:DNA-binding GntR family transcriptional regulator